MKYARNDACIYTDLEPVDMNDPENAGTAIEYGLPEGFSNKAKACWSYFSGAGGCGRFPGQSAYAVNPSLFLRLSIVSYTVLLPTRKPLSLVVL